jgi:hypothetical protein
MLPGRYTLERQSVPAWEATAMEWIGANKDLLSLSIAFLAILVSLSTVLISLRNARTNSFVTIQNVMLSADMQRGRLLVYKAIETGRLPPRESDDEYLMIRSLAVFDLLGMFSRQGVVPRKWVLRFWHARLQVMRRGFGMERDATRPYIIQGRPDLQHLINQAVRYRCRQSCCADHQRERRLHGAKEPVEKPAEATLPPAVRTELGRPDLAPPPGRQGC